MANELIILLLLFAAISYFIHTGIKLFSKGWSGYEEKMMQGAEKNLDAMYLTIPSQHISYLALACFFITTMVFLVLSGSWVVSLMVGTVALSFPLLLLRVLKKRRDRLFGLQLVPALNNMGNALKAGLSLSQAIDLIHREMESPISQEFRLLARELHFGESMAHALSHLENRMPNQDLSLMVTAVNISSEVGGNLANVFENISTTIRERQTLEAKVKSLTAQGKMQGTVMCLIPVGLGGILTVLYPDMMRPLYETNMGYALMGVCTVMLITGWFFIVRLTRIDF